jgi:hypothetical protein
METFVYRSLNQGERNKDSSKVFSIGPFAWVLGVISYKAQSNKKKFKWDPSTLVFRGVQLPKSIFNEFKDKQIRNEELILNGYQSTSLSK